MAKRPHDMARVIDGRSSNNVNRAQPIRAHGALPDGSAPGDGLVTAKAEWQWLCAIAVKPSSIAGYSRRNDASVWLARLALCHRVRRCQLVEAPLKGAVLSGAIEQLEPSILD
ncbi:hypothetical protein FDECE_13671 [Fusarium decemcellulare]|nr:hypothetical protein FDECE_13671 [Fusarium decemcellulare]